MFRTQNLTAISHPSLLTATNAQDHVTSERGGPGPYRAVEPWLYYYYYYYCILCIVFKNRTLLFLAADVIENTHIYFETNSVPYQYVR
jgi:hypothetical protein